MHIIDGHILSLLKGAQAPLIADDFALAVYSTANGHPIAKQGKEIPLKERQVNAGDVVEACVTINGQLLQIASEDRPFLGISRTVSSVVLLQTAPETAETRPANGH